MIVSTMVSNHTKFSVGKTQESLFSLLLCPGIILRVMLTSAPRILVKDTKR
jgi:hypothetical protein